ncbi:MAG: tetratricopeptide repeat protein, partial [Weeksellaceae bacterium]|nr:tetratricopeptide repeat protein [Weeksellaceae bacterium]
ITDSVQLRENFTLLKNNFHFKNVEKVDIIYKVLLANLNSRLNDNINPTSNLLFEDALKSSKKLNENDIIAWVNTQYGFYYYTYSEYTKAFPYFIESSRILDATEDQNIFLANDILKRNGFYFGAVNDKQKEIDYLNRALNNTSNTSKEYANILNAIGHHYLNTGNLEKAKDYFLKTMIYSKKNIDEIRYAKSLGDLANIYKIQKKYPEAIKFLKEDIKISKRNNDERNTMYAEILLGKVYMDQENYSDAYEILYQAHVYASKKDYLKSYELEINELLLLIAIKNNNTNKELELRRELSNLKDELSNYNGIDVISTINWQVQKENINYKLEAEIAKSEKESLANKTLLLISIILILTILFIIFNYRKRLKRQRSEYENTVLKLQVEKLKSEKKLGQTHKTLNSYKTYLSEKNNQIDDLKYEINNIRDSKISYLEEKQGELNKLLNSHLMTEENWLAFKQTFINEKYDYYEFLMENYPNLTDSNLRIIFLQKLGLSNSETAQLLGVTIDAIKKAKQRLRKKFPESYDYLFKYED